MTIIVTGAAGFIGANIVQALNTRGEKNIIAVDDLRPADKYRNLADLDIIDYLDKDEFLEAFRSGRFGKVKANFILERSLPKRFSIFPTKVYF